MGKRLVSFFTRNPERFRPVWDALRAADLEIQSSLPNRESFPRRGQQSPDVVVVEDLTDTDLIWGLCQSLVSREAPWDTPVILLSHETNREEEFFEAGVCDVLPHRVEDHRLIARINLQLSRKAYIDQLKRLTAFFHSREQIDGLTQLYLFPVLERHLESEITQATAENPFSFCLIHLDQFGAVNSHQGHMWGDLLIMELSRVLRESLPSSAIAARFSADKLAVTLPNATKVDAQGWAEKLLENIHDQSPVLQGEPMTVSIGIITFPEERVDCSDALLYLLVQRTERAIAEGGDRIVAVS